MWPGVAIGAVVANVLNGAGPEASLGIAVGNTLAPVVAVWLLRRFGFDAALARLRDALLLVFVGGLAAMTISATFGTGVLWLTDQVGDSLVRSVWLVWWVGDAFGVVLFAPFFLLLGNRSSSALGARTSARSDRRSPLHDRMRGRGLRRPGADPYLAFLPVVWTAIRFEQTGAASATVLITVIAVIETVSGRGPLSFTDAELGLVSLQTFNASIALTALVLAAIRTERTGRARGTPLERGALSQALRAGQRPRVHPRAGRTHHLRERGCGAHHRLHARSSAGDDDRRARRIRVPARPPAHDRPPARRRERAAHLRDRRSSAPADAACRSRSAHAVVHEEAAPSGVQLIGRDVTSRRLAEEQLRHRVLHDDVTGLPNETLLREQLTYAMAFAERAQTSLALLVVDIDGFRELNRAIGTTRGDAVLRAVGPRSRPDCARPTPWRGCATTSSASCSRRSIRSRTNGSEPAIISDVGAALSSVRPATPLSDHARAKGRFADMREVERMRAPDDADVRIPSASVGIVTFPGRSRDASTLVQHADLAMHAARQSGGGTSVVYGPQHDPTTMRSVVSRGRPAGRDRAGSDPRAVPAEDRPPVARHGGRRVRGALGTPAARNDPVGGACPHRRARRPRGRAHRMDVEGSAPALAHVDGSGSRPHRRGERHVRRARPCVVPRRAACLDRAPARHPGPPHDRDRRARHHGRVDPRRRDAPHGHGRVDRHRQLRDGLLVARPAPASPDLRDARSTRPSSSISHRVRRVTRSPTRSSSSRTTSACRSWPTGSRRARPGRSSSSSAATTRRDR